MKRIGLVSGIVLPDAAFRALREFAETRPILMTVWGESMKPALLEGFRVWVRRRRRYWPGDLLAFRSGSGHLVIHRLLGCTPGRGGWQLYTKGDNLECVDPPVAISQIIGRVEEIEDTGISSVPIHLRLGSAGALVRAFVRHWGRRLFFERDS